VPRPAITFEFLAERLRDGPLRTLLTLDVKAGMLSAEGEGDAERVEKLVELVQLARVAMAQFHDFTLELQSLIDQLAAAERNER
jgi:hypothetical protein